MNVRQVCGGAISALVLLAVPVVALVSLGPTAARSDAFDDRATLVAHDDGVPASVATTSDADQFVVVDLANWTYTGHKAGHDCPPGLAKKEPGHPGHDFHCASPSQHPGKGKNK